MQGGSSTGCRVEVGRDAAWKFDGMEVEREGTPSTGYIAFKIRCLPFFIVDSIRPCLISPAIAALTLLEDVPNISASCPLVR